jgi:hypothetical protein
MILNNFSRYQTSVASKFPLFISQVLVLAISVLALSLSKFVDFFPLLIVIAGWNKWRSEEKSFEL